MSGFLMRLDSGMTEFLDDIAREMVERFAISRAEALAQINDRWGGLGFDPYPDLVCHESPEYWAYGIYYEDRVPYWRADEDRSRWRVVPPPPAGSPCWTLPPTVDASSTDVATTDVATTDVATTDVATTLGRLS
ncbi:hypothetical protein [Kitasatospora sp. NPDC050543]|uniref:hypothetical protein n=1 Tax=Kitasatospora sp. NPDC050543 TaxID=3364054 RepID=UPI0037A5FE07